jgi:uncharacterized alpha-E superfamily protein
VSLLARNAEQLFWLARYIERAGSLARIIEIHSSYGRAGADDLSWGWLVALYSNADLFAKSYPETTFKNVVDFYVADASNPASIRFAVRAARENARALRAVIPNEMWTQLNAFHQRLAILGESDFDLVGLSRTCGLIKVGCYAQLGVVDSTLFRDEGERFFRLGLMIERADQTTRLLDVKFAQLASGDAAGRAIADPTFWSLVLRSAAAYQAFRRNEPHGADPSRVARFLLVNASQPRSVTYCVHEIQRVLEELRSGYQLRQTHRALEMVEILREGLQSAARDRDLVRRLHTINDWLQGRLIALTTELDAAFFTLAAPAPAVQAPTQSQSQSQSQSQTQSSGPQQAGSQSAS